MKSPSISKSKKAAGLLLGSNPARGFTLIEVLVVMTLFSLFASFGLFIGLDFYRNYAFHSAESVSVSAIQKARMRSLVNMNQAPHGVRIEQSHYTIFEGASYASRLAVLDEVIALPAAVSISGISSFPLDIVFNQLDGSVAAPASIRLSDGARSSTIKINTEGRIDW